MQNKQQNFCNECKSNSLLTAYDSITCINCGFILQDKTNNFQFTQQEEQNKTQILSIIPRLGSKYSFYKTVQVNTLLKESNQYTNIPKLELQLLEQKIFTVLNDLSKIKQQLPIKIITILMYSDFCLTQNLIQFNFKEYLAYMKIKFSSILKIQNQLKQYLNIELLPKQVTYSQELDKYLIKFIQILCIDLDNNKNYFKLQGFSQKNMKNGHKILHQQKLTLRNNQFFLQKLEEKIKYFAISLDEVPSINFVKQGRQKITYYFALFFLICKYQFKLQMRKISKSIVHKQIQTVIIEFEQILIGMGQYLVKNQHFSKIDLPTSNGLNQIMMNDTEQYNNDKNDGKDSFFSNDRTATYLPQSFLENSFSSVIESDILFENNMNEKFLQNEVEDSNQQKLEIQIQLSKFSNLRNQLLLCNQDKRKYLKIMIRNAQNYLVFEQINQKLVERQKYIM